MLKRTVIALLLLAGAGLTACSSALSSGAAVTDEAHQLTIVSGQIVEKLGESHPGEGKAYLVLKYEAKNLQAQVDSLRRWTEQISFEADREPYQPEKIDGLTGEQWETTLAPGQAQAGYIAYTVPDDIQDVKLTVIMPVSSSKSVYEFKPKDKRVSINSAYVVKRLEQIGRTQRIPVIGRPLAAFTNSPIRYLGVVLVPRNEIGSLLDKTKGLEPAPKEQAVEEYLLASGQCRLD